MWSKFIITNGTTAGTFDVLRYLKEWLPRLASAKDGGYWSGSGYTQGRQLFGKEFENILDTYILNLVTGSSTDTNNLISDLTLLLDQAVSYWINDFQIDNAAGNPADRPVWIEARLRCQDVSRYSLIYDWSIPQLAEYFVAPYLTNGMMPDISLIVERGLWLENPPTESTQIELQSANTNIAENTDRKRTWVSNYMDWNPLTHVFVYDAAPVSWTNITGLTGVNLLPAVPAVGDILYVGVREPGTASPFHNIIFNIGVAAAGMTIIPEYSRGGGAWGNISTYGWSYINDTYLFTNTGPNVVVFDYPGGMNSWQTDIVNGITAWWIRFRVSAITVPVAPTQVTDIIYTQEQPYFDIPADQISGTYPAQMKYELWRRDDCDNETGAYRVIGTKVLLGLRSLDRGADFIGFLPAYNTILPANLAYTINLGATQFQGNVPWARPHRWVAGGVSTGAIPGYWSITDPRSRDYAGTYRVFLRVKDNSPNVGDIETRLGFAAGNIANMFYITDYRSPVTNGVEVFLDFGLVTIPKAFQDTAYDYDLYVVMECNSNATSTNIYFYDLILFPADECILDLEVAANNNWQTFDQGEILLPDSISNPKFEITSELLREDLTATVIEYALSWQARTPGENIANVNQSAGQRVWSLILYNQNYLTGGEPDYRVPWSTAVSVRAWRNQRYKQLGG